MQYTEYRVNKWVDRSHCVEITPYPRSKRSALLVAEQAATDGHKITVERHVVRREIIKTFNKPQKDS